MKKVNSMKNYYLHAGLEPLWTPWHVRAERKSAVSVRTKHPKGTNCSWKQVFCRKYAPGPLHIPVPSCFLL